MKSRTAVLVLIGILSAGIGVYVGTKRFTPAAPVATASSQLFALSLPDANATPVRLAQFAGKPLIVNFWATWCPPCVEEMPELSELQRELTVDKARIVGIGIDSPSNIAEFAKKHKIDYPLLVAGLSGTELSRNLGNTAGGLPFTVLLGSDGQVKKSYLGRLKMEELRRDVLATN